MFEQSARLMARPLIVLLSEPEWASARYRSMISIVQANLMCQFAMNLSRALSYFDRAVLGLTLIGDSDESTMIEPSEGTCCPGPNNRTLVGWEISFKVSL
jgi:hypothetical protein